MELTISRLVKNYKSNIAIEEFSIVLKEGVYGLLGANGAGKTTLMRIICGILKPTSGEVRFNGLAVDSEEYRDSLGYLPQEFGYYPEFTGSNFLMYMASLKGLPKEKAKERVKELLELVSLSNVSRKKIKTYSGGMKQRLGIAQAMLNNPKVLVLDEPTAGLDPKERVKFRNLIADLAKDRIILLSTHIVSDIEYIADEILLIKKGKLIKKGTVSQVTEIALGKVFLDVVSEEKLDELSAKYCIANIHHIGNQIEVRIITDNRPELAKEVKPTLEDAYMYCISDEKEALR